MKKSIILSRMGGDPNHWMSRPIWVMHEWFLARGELYEEEKKAQEGG
ncbi:hypothetical protein [Paenibacillus sp. 3LSP]|nr:hypothetical protein [Paenibacillus sp. 3LSP]